MKCSLTVIVLATAMAGSSLLGQTPTTAPSRTPSWPTASGNMQRTGCLDDHAGPTKPKVLWVYMDKKHFIASPSLTDKGILVGGVGLFNSGTLDYLSLDLNVKNRRLWFKSSPLIERPMVCGPALADGLVVFGDGVHSSNTSNLTCLQLETGRPVWQLSLTGRFVHMEGTPTIDNDRVYTGAGNGGIICINLKRVIVDGKEQDLAAGQAFLDRRWQELQDKYERDRKRSPGSAKQPREDALPKLKPVVVWQKGADKWHVDSVLAVAGDNVLAASTYVDADSIGRRSLLCLKASNGEVLWDTPLTLNPWGGPAVAGDLAIVGCSTISADPGRTQSARGQVVAVDIASGKIKWKRDIAGGVLSPVAIKDKLAVFTATDGKIYALDAASGEVKWSYAGGGAFFAGVAIAGGTVYAADLKCVLHAVALADGKKLWSLNLPADPSIRRPGMAYGIPAMKDGRIYVSACNMTDSNGLPCWVACIGDASEVPDGKR